MAKAKNIIEYPDVITIVGAIKPVEIVKKVVNTFIDFEKDKKGKGVIFKYPVEKFASGEVLYIIRPGKKWNFDFKVDLKPEYQLGKGTHDQIAIILRKLKQKERNEFKKIWLALTNVYDCTESNVLKVLNEIKVSLFLTPNPEILLKVLKWLFIMEDILYWHFEGRAFLYNFFLYSISETNENKFNGAIDKIRIRKW